MAVGEADHHHAVVPAGKREHAGNVDAAEGVVELNVAGLGPRRL